MSSITYPSIDISPLIEETLTLIEGKKFVEVDCADFASYISLPYILSFDGKNYGKTYFSAGKVVYKRNPFLAEVIK